MSIFQKKKQSPRIIAGRWAEPVHFYIMGFHYWTENNPCSPPEFKHSIINDGGVFRINDKRIGHNITTPGELAALIDHIKNN